VHTITVFSATDKDREAIQSQLLNGDEVSVIQIGLIILAIANKKEAVESYWVGYKHFRDATPFSATMTGCPYHTTVDFLRSMEPTTVHPTEPTAPIRSIALGNFFIRGGDVARDGTAVVAINEELIQHPFEYFSDRVAQMCPFSTTLVIRGQNSGQISLASASTDRRPDKNKKERPKRPNKAIPRSDRALLQSSYYQETGNSKAVGVIAPANATSTTVVTGAKRKSTGSSDSSAVAPQQVIRRNAAQAADTHEIEQLRVTITAVQDANATRFNAIEDQQSAMLLLMRDIRDELKELAGRTGDKEAKEKNVGKF
jgi:hypothetical protein